MTIAERPADQLMLELSIEEKETFTRCEETIRENLQTFLKVGEALQQIRDGRLYRQTHGSFEDYLRDRWDMVRSSAYRLIAASQIVSDLSPIGDTGKLPTNESQVRELSRLPEDQRQEAWEAAVERAKEFGCDVTAAIVREIVDARLPERPEQPPVDDRQLDVLTAIAEAESGGVETAPTEGTPFPVKLEEIRPAEPTDPDLTSWATGSDLTDKAAAPAAVASSPATVAPVAPIAPPAAAVPAVSTPPAAPSPTAAPVASTPAPAPAPVAPATPAAASTAPDWTTCLIPGAEAEWLTEQGMTAGLALSKLRELLDIQQQQAEADWEGIYVLKLTGDVGRKLGIVAEQYNKSPEQVLTSYIERAFNNISKDPSESDPAEGAE